MQHPLMEPQTHYSHLQPDASFDIDSTITSLEWDFDGDNIADATSPVSGNPITGETTAFTYGLKGLFTPQVRAIDSDGLASPWTPHSLAVLQEYLISSVDLEYFLQHLAMQHVSSLQELSLIHLQLQQLTV